MKNFVARMKDDCVKNRRRATVDIVSIVFRAVFQRYFYVLISFLSLNQLPFI